MPARIALFSASALDQFDLVAFRCIDKCDPAAAALVRAVRERITFRGRSASEFIQIIDLESQMRQIGTDHDRPAFVELADLNFLLALWRFEENKLRTAPGSMPANFLETQHVLVEGDRLLQGGHAVASV